ncbi:MAG: beta-phosphoglucomutase [Hyphomonadaceae bacterium]|nr:beta-phosphoglucomutase [Clostridia bacterium]
MKLKAVIFDLDGVIVSTDDCHYQAWKRMAVEENIEFDREINERLRGVSRLESLEIILEKASCSYMQEKKLEMSNRKNEYYIQLISTLTADNILPGVQNLLDALKRQGIKIAIGSSSRNSPIILEKIGLSKAFDAIADGNDIVNSKPDPEVFLLASKRLGVSPEHCLVIEDAASGVEAALGANMKVLGIGGAALCDQATFKAQSLEGVDANFLINEFVK